MQSIIAHLSLAVLTLTPLIWRLAQKGGSESIGLMSDGGAGILVLVLLLWSPRWLRVLLALIWAAFMVGASELVAAMNRLPTWEDLHYLTNVDFVKNSTANFHLASPALAWTMSLAALAVGLLPLARPRWRYAGLGLLAGIAVLLLQNHLSLQNVAQSVVARYNPLHWFLVDVIVSPPLFTARDLASYQLPQGLDRADLDGIPLLAKGKAKNVLIITLEGIPGLYYPEIRTAMGVDSAKVSMNRLAESARDAMLVPDFTVHSHQTIRGLYALLCGDFSKQSWNTPKAVELLGNPERAQECLPAQMAGQGWETHFLQAAGLAFMGKDRFMPLIGFQQVHGNDWFQEANPYPFEWGVVDSVFFRGARDYIAGLRQKQHPWMLTLLTVGTHQPYTVPEDIVANHPDRRSATVDLLDQAVAQFIEDLRQDGVLDDTLVIVTSDESHGSEEAGDWVSSWGLAIVLAPEAKQLPHLKQGGYGLVDVEASILDYLGLPMPSQVVGRSLFRDYVPPREMVSFTASKRRWHTADNLRYECTDDGHCRVGKADSLLGPPPAVFRPDTEGRKNPIFQIAAVLDRKLLPQQGVRVLKFANGETRHLPAKSKNEWSDNLVGAQYLDFPVHSRVQVSIRVKVLQASAEGVQLKLILKQWESTIKSIKYDEFPLLHAEEEGRLEFTFDNQEARQAFSFHLLGEGKGATVQMVAFDVTVEN